MKHVQSVLCPFWWRLHCGDCQVCQVLPQMEGGIIISFSTEKNDKTKRRVCVYNNYVDLVDKTN
jgi:hypothetical protein